MLYWVSCLSTVETREGASGGVLVVVVSIIVTSIDQRLVLLLEIRYSDNARPPAQPQSPVKGFAQLQQRVTVVELYQTGYEQQ